jgi:hypothetical protein
VGTLAEVSFVETGAFVEGFVGDVVQREGATVVGPVETLCSVGLGVGLNPLNESSLAVAGVAAQNYQFGLVG